MIDTIELVNLTTNSSLKFTKTAKNPYLLETDGINWDVASANHNTYTNLTGIGNFITSTKINDRTISITGRVCCPKTMREIAQEYNISSIEEINTVREKEIYKNKKALSQLINPDDYIRVQCGVYMIDGKPTTSVRFSESWSENNEIYCKFTFSLYCENPMFRYRASNTKNLSGVNGGFHFPVVIPKNRGMHFGLISNYQLAIVVNDSDISLGGIITFQATGTVKNPVLTNVLTEEEIKIAKTLQQGEIIVVDTTERTVKGTTDGLTYTNYLQYWDFDNTWLQFRVGQSILGFSGDDETYKNLLVSVGINKSFFSMEDQ